MQRILFAAAAFVLTGPLTATAQEAKPAQPPAARPGAVPAQPVQPRVIPVTAARMLQLEEDFETAEAHRDVKKAYVKAAEVAVDAAKTRYELVAKAGAAGVSATELNAAKSELEMAKAQLDVRTAELKESEVKVKFAKKRLDDAKAAGVRPVPNVRPVPVDPAPNALPTEKPIPGLKAKLDTLLTQAEQHAEKVKRAGLALVVAQDNLAKLRDAAKVGRLQPGTLERAEAVVAETQAQFAKLSAERKALDAEIDAARKKLAEIGK